MTSLFIQSLQLEISPQLVFLPLIMPQRKLPCIFRTLSHVQVWWYLFFVCFTSAVHFYYLWDTVEAFWYTNNVLHCLTFAYTTSASLLFTHPQGPAIFFLCEAERCSSGTHLSCLAYCLSIWNVIFSGFNWVPKFCVYHSHFQ